MDVERKVSSVFRLIKHDWIQTQISLLRYYDENEKRKLKCHFGKFDEHMNMHTYAAVGNHSDVIAELLMTASSVRHKSDSHNPSSERQ